VLKIVRGLQKVIETPYSARMHHHHSQLIEGYLQSHQIRNHAALTTSDIERFLNGWFKLQGSSVRPLFTWEAMEPVNGRNRIVLYGKVLCDVQAASKTIRKKLGTLRNYFEYVLEHPFVFDLDKPSRISDLYGAIEQPVSEFDIPKHGYDGEQKGVPLDPEKIYDFFDVVRSKYLTLGRSIHTKARDYTMIVLAAESGLRVSELRHLEISKDLFFESKKLQTRFAKGTKGSGKRTRLTLFTPLARDTVQYYLKYHRPHLVRNKTTDRLFLSRTGGNLTYRSVQETLDNIVELTSREGFPVMDHLTWHWFRRIFATRFIEKFPDKLDVLVALLGHSTYNTVHAYIRHSKAWHDERIKELLEGDYECSLDASISLGW
jgi:site-specific recombinase XerD